MSTRTAEQAYEQFAKHRSLITAAQGSNESTVRLRAIDTLAFDVLGWDKATVDTEKYTRDIGFADYAFPATSGIALILEAKKSGSYFTVPGIEIQSGPIGISLLQKECPPAQKALIQAIGYAATLGARYVAISNGHQWLLTLSYVPEQPIEDRSAFVFESIDAIDRRFREFFNTFSPDAILGNRPADALLESRKTPAPPKLSSRIHGYPRPASRNELANELWAALTAAWSEVRQDESEKSFLERCYVEVDPTAAQLTVAREIIAQRISADEVYQVVPGGNDTAVKAIDGGLAEKPVIVLGRVGHGKTTFLHYLRQIRAADLLTNYIQLDVNFIDRPDAADQVGDFVNDAIATGLRERYSIDIDANNLVRGFLHTEIERFKTSYDGQQYPEGSEGYKELEREFIHSIRKDPHSYLARVFAHLRRGRHNSVAIFLDNLDRRLDPIQEEAFLKASAMARDWAAVVFVCLRPSTFHRSKHFGVLDTVDPRVITIAPPKTHLLVSKRLEYAHDIASGTLDTDRSKHGITFGPELSVILPTAAAFLGAVSDSFKKNRNLCRLFESVSNGNARDTLKDVLTVLTSQHLNSQKIADQVEIGKYVMPVHEALRALMYGDVMDYDPSQSKFINMFDCTRSDPTHHFTRLATLLHLSQQPTGHPSYGFLSVTQLSTYLKQLGYSSVHVAETIQYLFDEAYMESRIPIDQWAGDVEHVRITARGSYVTRDLLKQFVYCDAVVIDTPIIDDSYRRRITDVNGIGDRLDRAQVFLKYLDNSVLLLQDALIRNAWSVISKAVEHDITHIRRRIQT